MKEILLYLAEQNFVDVLIKSAVAGLLGGFGGSLIFSLIGYSCYKTFNLIERSAE